MGTSEAGGAAGRDGKTPTPTPGRRRLTATELHAQRVAWGKEYGQAMREIKQAHEKEGG